MKIAAYLVIVSSLLVLTACGTSDISKSSQVLARVGDKEITTSFFDRQLVNLPESVQKLSSQGKGKKAILEAFVNRELLYGDAIKKKIDKSADLQKKFEDLKKEMVINTYLQEKLAGKVKVEDKEIQNFYNNNPAEFKNRREIRISQIVVPDEATAQQMLTKLSIKRDFGELANTHSTDKASAARNGDVGFFSYRALPEKIRDEVFNLPVGAISKPYKLDGGYEIYKITDKRVLSFSFDQVKEAIRARLYQEKLQKELKVLVAELKKDTKVQINEALLK